MNTNEQNVAEQLNTMIAETEQEVSQLKTRINEKKKLIKQYQKALKAIKPQ